MVERAKNMEILQLAVSQFDRDISLAEQRLFKAAARSDDADCSDLTGKDRIIRADRLSWLCTSPVASSLLTHRGLSLIGAEVHGKVDLKWAKISFPITATKCVFKHEIILSHGHFLFFGLLGGSVRCLEAKGSHFGDSVVLNDYFKAERGVDFEGARIEGNLECDRAQFIGNDEGLALNANGIQIKGSLYLRYGFEAKGQVNLVAAKIDRNLECDGGKFVRDRITPVLKANSAKVEGNVFLRDDFKADGGVDLVTAKIGGYLCCEGEFIENEKTLALEVNGVEVGKNLCLNKKFKADGGVDLVAAKIGGNLECEHGQFIGNEKALALDANSAQVKGNAFLSDDFKAERGVNFVAAKINGNLNCVDGQFIGNEKRPALDAERVEVEVIDKLRNLRIDPNPPEEWISLSVEKEVLNRRVRTAGLPPLTSIHKLASKILSDTTLKRPGSKNLVLKPLSTYATDHLSPPIGRREANSRWPRWPTSLPWSIAASITVRPMNCSELEDNLAMPHGTTQNVDYAFIDQPKPDYENYHA